MVMLFNLLSEHYARGAKTFRRHDIDERRGSHLQLKLAVFASLMDYFRVGLFNCGNVAGLGQ